LFGIPAHFNGFDVSTDGQIIYTYSWEWTQDTQTEPVWVSVFMLHEEFESYDITPRSGHPLGPAIWNPNGSEDIIYFMDGNLYRESLGDGVTRVTRIWPDTVTAIAEDVNVQYMDWSPDGSTDVHVQSRA
jgi:hypothetical protein